jgi:hypothetical protein
MIAQIGEVLATYWRRAISNPFAMLAVSLLLFSIVGSLAAIPMEPKEIALMQQQHILLAIGMMICPVFLGSALVAMHFKQQIIQIHKRRIPNAVAAHVIVLVGFLFLLAVVVPAASMAIRTWSWGVLGLILALTAVSFAVFASPRRWTVLFIPFVFIVWFSPVQKWLEQLCQGGDEAFGLSLLAVGVCGIAATLVWLLRMNEENAGFIDLMELWETKRYSQFGLGAACAQPQAASWLYRLRTPSARQVPLWRQWARGSLWKRVRLWNVVRTDGGWGTAIVLFLGIWGIASMESPDLRPSALPICAFYIMFAPVFSVAMAWQQQRQMATIELLRPIMRSQFLIEMGLTYAYRAAIECVRMNIAWCALAYVLAAGTPNWSQTLSALVVIAALQVLTFGLAIWMMRYAWFTLLAAMVIFLAALLILEQFIDWRTATLGALVWVTPGIVAAGALIAWDACRRWMQTELG